MKREEPDVTFQDLPEVTRGFRRLPYTYRSGKTWEYVGKGETDSGGRLEQRLH